MKKPTLILSLFALLFCAQSVLAQNFSLGPRLGVNFSQLAGEFLDYDSKIGVVLGITTTYSFSESTGIGVDILYSVEGAKVNKDSDFNLGYVRIPIVFQYFFRGLGDNLRPKILAGIVPGFLSKVRYGQVDDEIIFHSSFDLGATAGLGFHYHLDEMVWLNTDLRYLQGFSNFFDELEDSYNQHWQLSMGVTFGL